MLGRNNGSLSSQYVKYQSDFAFNEAYYIVFIQFFFHFEKNKLETAKIWQIDDNVTE